MIYDIRQVSTYRYASPVPFSRHIMRMVPVDRANQRVILCDLDIEPPPGEYDDTLDFFGNRTASVAIAAPHDKLRIELRARVEVNAPEPFLAGLTPEWTEVRDLASGSDDLGPDSPVHFVFASPAAPLDAATTAYAAESFPPGRPVLEGAIDLMTRIHRDFKYSPGATDAQTRPAEAFAKKKGVCQDFAHVMIAGMRGIGLPVAYVSGFLRTIPPEGRPRLEGADATHAWAQVWCGEELGWIGLDPTNDIPAGEDHIVVAVGRDYSDVSPIDGVIVVSGGQTLDVGVDVIPFSPDAKPAAPRVAAPEAGAAEPRDPDAPVEERTAEVETVTKTPAA
ncbi:transglutaminase family protein [Methylobrevis albus]|uniref:Transglutaminase family protein n=1 Tax=Methylobrevis albus TaxID=2793297 RepID=A0A931MWT7_9HYPH|nr:transglutaminase family protein [Methylobrevis albus]MBH0237803.1 transglutaminase family protein [Methylobrevis albus]